MLKTETDSKCRLSTISWDNLIISACQILAKEQYIERDDGVCAHLHFTTCKEIGVK
jgi:hypothetical protein